MNHEKSWTKVGPYQQGWIWKTKKIREISQETDSFNQTDPERKEKPEEKIFTFAVSNNLKFELLFRRSYVFYNIVLYEKIEHDKFMGGSFFFFKFKLVVIWFFTREPFIVTDKCDYRKLIPSRSVEVKGPEEPWPLQI